MIARKLVFGFDIVQADADELARALLDQAQERRGTRVVCINPHSIETAQNDAEFDSALRNADVRLCDGVGIVVAAGLFLRQRLKRLTGPALFTAVNTELGRRGGSVLLLGGVGEWNERLLAQLVEQNPGLRATAYAPPFKSRFEPEDINAMQDEIDRCKPDVLWVGVGSPKQEKLMAMLDGPSFGVAGAVGAAFDFSSGRVKRAPSIVRNLGLEWAYRLMQQPRRLGARTFRSAPRFLALAYKLRGARE
ncbi:WecB/TagA/CpsF family glycosyltransferase [Sphingomonas psychrotolerans]|uniref:Glycosyltransferase n=1 Tax=Sphingomonas psychrotolerans TaxID=1327635 RepID=A0A2K8MK80_9SPHN|nr:WecB/TagA/CpsF family glycosyltransferase [Sphingomonas psychrotolerans]ATY34292.1 hypothetical protein CVN68_21940 [Sphingomonas psychrotolerans]